MKVKTTITLDEDVKEKAMNIASGNGQRLSPLIEIYLKEFIEKNESK